ncbi:MAG: M24 family metallopeptidase, partial [Actinomycetota bacterium]
TLAESELVYGITVRHIDSLDDFLASQRETLIIRGDDNYLDSRVKENSGYEELASWVSEARLVKDEYEIAEMRKAIDATHRGFEDMIKQIPSSIGKKRGERLIEGAFFTRARFEGNDMGYDSIVAAGSHACVLHWIRNDGQLRDGELLLIDAGVEMDSLFTADITRTFPINGRFTPAQRK